MAKSGIMWAKQAAIGTFRRSLLQDAKEAPAGGGLSSVPLSSPLADRMNLDVRWL